MKFWHFLVNFHLLGIIKFTTASWAYVHYCLDFHLFLPLLGQLLGCTPSALLLVHFFWDYGLLLFFELLLTFLFELLHSYWRSCFFLLDLSLSLTVVVIILLLRFILRLFFSFTSLIWQRFEVIIIRLITRIHDSNTLSGYFEIGFVSNFIGLCCFLRGKELNKSEIFELPCKFIFNLSDISHRHHSLEGLQQYILLYLSNNRSSNHQTAVFCRLLFKITRRWLGAVAKSAIYWFRWFASIAFVSSCKIFVITFLAVPIIS